MDADKKKKLDELYTQLDELTKARDAETNGNKKAPLTKKINELTEQIEDLESGGKIHILARSSTGRESYRRAGIKFTGEMEGYDVTEEELAILEADPNIKLEKKDSKTEK